VNTRHRPTVLPNCSVMHTLLEARVSGWVGYEFNPSTRTGPHHEGEDRSLSKPLFVSGKLGAEGRSVPGNDRTPTRVDHHLDADDGIQPQFPVAPPVAPIPALVRRKSGPTSPDAWPRRSCGESLTFEPHITVDPVAADHARRYMARDVSVAYSSQ
jgi:hypothetical protein